MADMSDLHGPIKFMIVAAILIALLPTMFAIGPAEGSAVLNANGGDDVLLDTSIREMPGDVTVKATKGNAVHLDGNAYVEADEPADLDNGSWTVCAATYLDPDANADATYSVYAYENETIVLQYDGGDWLAYYDNGSADGKATIDAPGPAAENDGGFLGLNDDEGREYAPVCARFDDSSDELAVISDTASSTSTLTTETTSRDLARNWVGSIDEVRTFDGAVTDSKIDAYTADQIQPLPGTNRSSRMMFDEGSGSSSTVYFASGDATLHGAAWADGVDDPGLTEGQDYDVEANPLSVTIIAGGYLDGSPVQYVSWGPNLPFDIIGLMGVLFGILVLVGFRDHIMDFME